MINQDITPTLFDPYSTLISKKCRLVWDEQGYLETTEPFLTSLDRDKVQGVFQFDCSTTLNNPVYIYSRYKESLNLAFNVRDNTHLYLKVFVDDSCSFDITIQLKGVGSSCRVELVSALSGATVAKLRLSVVHTERETTSRIVERNLLDGTSVMTSLVDILIKPQGADSHSEVMINSILFSPKARMEAKPEFSILTDETMCKHGVTCRGLLDEELWFLQARGLNIDQIKKLIAYEYILTLFNES